MIVPQPAICSQNLRPHKTSQTLVRLTFFNALSVRQRWRGLLLHSSVRRRLLPPTVVSLAVLDEDVVGSEPFQNSSVGCSVHTMHCDCPLLPHPAHHVHGPRWCHPTPSTRHDPQDFRRRSLCHSQPWPFRTWTEHSQCAHHKYAVEINVVHAQGDCEDQQYMVIPGDKFIEISCIFPWGAGSSYVIGYHSTDIAPQISDFNHSVMVPKYVSFPC